MQFYDGPPRPAEQVAQVDGRFAQWSIAEIDGDTTLLEGGARLEFLPGEHRLTAVDPGEIEHRLAFAVEAGRNYELEIWGGRDLVLIESRKDGYAIDRGGSFRIVGDHLRDGERHYLESASQNMVTRFVAPVPGPEDVIVRAPDGATSSGLWLLAIDGQDHSPHRGKLPTVACGFAVRLSPGHHSFSLLYRGYYPGDAEGLYAVDIPGRDHTGLYALVSSIKVENAEMRVAADLEAGKTYVVVPGHFDLSSDGAVNWVPVIVEDTLGNVYRDVNDAIANYASSGGR